MSIEEAMAKGTFSVLAAVQKRAYPTADVTVHTDAGTAYEIVALLEESDAPGTTDARVNAIDKKVKALLKELGKSALTFHMRGISQGLSDSISEEAAKAEPDDEEARNIHSNMAHLAAHIVRVTDAEGNVDEHLFTREEADALRGFLPPDEFERIYTKMNELTFQARYFDRAVSADFLSKR